MLKAQENAKKIAFFLDICKDRRLSEMTYKTYDTALSGFYDFLLEKDKLFEDLQIFDIRDYKINFLKGYAPSSQNLKLSVIRKFYDTLAEYNIFSYNPVAISFTNRLEKKALTFVPRDTYNLVESYFMDCSSDNYVLGLRLMYFSGLRVGEVGQIDLTKDIIYKGDTMYIKVHGKGAKERIVPVFSRAAARQIKSFLAIHSSLLPLRIGSFQQIFDYHLKRAAKVLDIPAYSCHDFRRGFAVNLYSQTRDIELLRVLLGHESYNTSLMYIRNVTVKVYELPDSLFAWSRRRAKTLCLGTWCQGLRRSERSEFNLDTR